ncbi:hypothetical protein GCM10009078_21320 [Cupriavidus gilardii]
MAIGGQRSGKTSGKRGAMAKWQTRGKNPLNSIDCPEQDGCPIDTEHPVFRPRRAKTSGIAQDAGKKEAHARGARRLSRTARADWLAADYSGA